MQLGYWVSNQRQAIKRSKLSDEQRTKLEQIAGWTLDVRDAAWSQGIRLLREYAAREGHALVPQRHSEDGFRLGTWVTEQRQRQREGTLGAERAAELEAIPGWSWDKHEANWQTHYEALRRFAEREGHIPLGQSHMEGELRLGQWIANQRARGPTLDTEKRAKLEALPGWNWNPRDESWEQGCEALRQFVAREGHARVPTKHSEDGYPLGRWLYKRRGLRRSGRLPTEQAAWLERQPEWTWEPRGDRWERAYEALAKYAHEHDTVSPPLDYVTDDIALGAWVRTRRVEYADGKLSDERRRRLEQLPGWSWNINIDAWERSFDVLQRHAEREGHASPPAAAREAGIGIGQWVTAQRTAYKRRRLAPDRVARLEALPGWEWDGNQAIWERNYRALQDYIEQTGHASPPQSATIGGIAVGNWVINLRQQHRKGLLSDDRAEALERLPRWHWSATARHSPAVAGP